MDLEERRELLLASVELLTEARNQWAESDAEVVTRAYEEALEDCFAAFRDGDMPGDCRALQRDVETVERQWRRYQDQVLQSGDPRRLPDNAFNAAFEAMETRWRGMEEPERKHLESIGDLLAQKVDERQICEIYGWMDPRTGQPQLWKLAEERAHPGKHTGPQSGFVPPAERERQEQDRRDREQLERVRARVREKAQAAVERPPEPLEELVAQGLSLRQIAGMHHMTVDEAADEIRELGLEPPELDYAPPEASRAPAEPEVLPEVERAIAAEQANPTRGRKRPRAAASDPVASEKPKTLEQSIVELHQAGKSPIEICRHVSRPDLEVKPAKVAAVIARWKSEPEAFAHG
jgi:hypothetical protein